MRRSGTKRKEDEATIGSEDEEENRQTDKRSRINAPASSSSSSSAAAATGAPPAARLQLDASATAPSSFPATAAAIAAFPFPFRHHLAPSAATTGVAARPQIDSRILHLLPDDCLVTLQIFLGTKLSQAQLMYRASRDGFAAEDWASRCGGKSNQLTLVQVRGNGYVFGAFTPFQWPVGEPAPDIADSTGATCMFSLVNGHGRPVKLRLKDSHKVRAGGLLFSCGPGFGDGDAVLMALDVAADQLTGNWAQPSAFEFDSAADGGAPITYDKTLLAGDDGKRNDCVQFAAAEVECWQL